MNHSNHILNDLVSATRDGKSFYELAQTKVNSPELKALFSRIAKVKGEIVLGLSHEISAAGDKPAETGTWAGDFNKLYTEVKALLGDKNQAFVAQLEDSEDRLMKAFEKALTDEKTSKSTHAIITAFMPEVRACHDMMRAQRIALKKAA